MKRHGLTVALGMIVMALGAASPAWAQKAVKIGFMAPLTGGAAQVGKDMVDGFKMYFEEHGYQLAGRKVELIIEDSQGRPEVAFNKLRKFVENDGADIVGGEAFAHIALALAPKINEFQIPGIF